MEKWKTEKPKEEKITQSYQKITILQPHILLAIFLTDWSVSICSCYYIIFENKTLKGYNDISSFTVVFLLASIAHMQKHVNLSDSSKY